MPRLSILIPFSGPVELFEDTLASVLQNRPDDTEVIVSHEGSYADPYDLGAEVEFLPQPPGASLPRLINAAAATASGDVLHVLQCGARVSDGWVEPALQAFQRDDVTSVSPLVVRADDAARVWARGVNYEAGGTRVVASAGSRCEDVAKLSAEKARVLGPTLAAAFYRRDAWMCVGGLDETLGDVLPDVDLALTFAELGWSCLPALSSVIQMATEPARSSSFSTGRMAERLFWRHARQRGLAWSLLCHPLAMLRAIVAELPKPAALMHLLGRGIAACEVGAAKKQLRRLEAAYLAFAEQQPAEVLSLDEFQARRAVMTEMKPVSNRRAA